ncbi:AAA family ATPase [Bradyrhizobium sp. AUGA SZCCT0176]|uniref:AAA family ATPase n=1 Tax=Bradyrhizobium sp. AUGA SZCCT0176 TaxID=2807664 RepID=UPI001BABD89A|nr:AAA family ATPase [Bradyrhizobium sp. AUGA SZCCT0176]MBR1228825.1 AAA family ATPase [Bradyrhizobium sp. AUGA SZCCT0176]
MPREMFGKVSSGGDMKRARITVKNYRGYSDTEPVVIEIGPGFTALLGRNNAGKSSFKLLFYELRPLFARLCQMKPASKGA